MLRLGPHRFFPVLNEELEPNGTSVLVSHLGRTGTAMPLPLLGYSRLTHGLGAVVDVEKSTTEDLPALAALGACGTTGLTNNHIWRSGGLVGPWGVWPKRTPKEYPITSAGYAQAGFDIYSYLLDMGFRIVPSAGTASGVHPVPPGWSRVYCSRAGRIHAARVVMTACAPAARLSRPARCSCSPSRGTSRVRSVKDADFPKNVEAVIEMLSRVTVDSAEVVVNGQAAAASRSQPPKAARIATLRGGWKRSSWKPARGSLPAGLPSGPGHAMWRTRVRSISGRTTSPFQFQRKEAEYLLGRVEAK